MNKRPQWRTGYLGVAMVIVLMLITLYMALAFPFTFLQMKQTETTEIKAVIVIGLAGEESPSPEAYFVNESPPENLNMIGYSQLTEVGKRRMYSLGKYLRLKYYHLLLNGNPHLLYARASDTNVHLESAQTLISAMNPPKDHWNWFLDGMDLNNWQPIAVHTNEAKYDDLLAPERSNCHHLEQDLHEWKNSSKYQQLLNDFRHDLQTLRTNTGLEFEDDLDILLHIESSLRVRKAYAPDLLPEWFSASMADRLNHIADVCAQSRYGIPEIQRLFVGRLLHELTTTINYKIREHKLNLAQIQAAEEAQKQNPPGDETGNEIVDLQEQQQKPSKLAPGSSSSQSSSTGGLSQASGGGQASHHMLEQRAKQHHSVQQTTRQFTNKIQDPNVFVYVVDKQRFIALMNSLHIYTCQPQFGSALIVELHFDPISTSYFLRLLTSSSDNPLVNSEPLRVNPSACGEEPECEPQQFEQNLRHLILDRSTWQEACNNYNLLPIINPTPQKSTDKDTYKVVVDDATTTTSKPQMQPELTTTTTSSYKPTIVSTTTTTITTTTVGQDTSVFEPTTQTNLVTTTSSPPIVQITTTETHATSLPNEDHETRPPTTPVEPHSTTTPLEPENAKPRQVVNNRIDNPRRIKYHERRYHENNEGIFTN